MSDVTQPEPPRPAHENRGELDSLFRRDTLAHTLSIELGEWSGGRATARALPGSEHCNFAGTVHGGYLYSAADVALSVASNSWGRMAFALSIDMQYVGAAHPGDELDFVAIEQTCGRSIGNYRLEVLRGERILATATGLTFRTDDWHLGADAWSEGWRARH